MKFKYLLIALFAFCLILNIHAAEVTIEKASLTARNAYFEKSDLYYNSLAYSNVVIQESFAKPNDNSPDYYVFTFSKGGFVIIAAEDGLSPVIGYSITGKYEDEDQPDSYRNFIQTYSDAVHFIREQQIAQTQDVQYLWEYYSSTDPDALNTSPKAKSVDPLLQCKWNQSYPYNVYCPADPNGPGGYVYAGCVATAMAQVMYYWRHPQQGTGTHTYYYPPYGSLTANFGATTYNWEGMQNAIDHEFPGPIAELQYHCGVAVDMMYGPNGSGAYSSDVPPALSNYFGYSPDCYFSWKDNYSNAVWKSMLKGNLDNSWPMYYSGYSSGGGHAFVCDGYQDESFHFNFGWGGSQDGFYTLLTVNGFNSGQGAVFDTYPNSNYPTYCTGNKVVNIKSGSITDGSGPIQNYQSNATCSWLFAPQTGEDSISSIKIVFRSFETESNDVVTIYNGPTVQAEVLGTFSGSELPPAITSTSNEVLLVFNSDGAGEAKGWYAEFTSIKPDFCKGVEILTDNAGTFSDGSLEFNYQNSTICMWKITPPDAQLVTLNFTSFNTEPFKDKVRVYDLETQELLAEYSGSYPATNLPAPVTSSSGKMFVAFSSNNSVTAPGWEANYVALTTGMNNTRQMEDEYTVFPNPATDRITIGFPEGQTGTMDVKLVSLTGMTMTGETWYNDGAELFHQLDVRDVPAGFYLLQITGNSGSVTKKITIR